MKLLVAFTLGLFGVGCGADLGECDMAAAEELVFSSTGLVATKGQALAHDSCGNGAFCHSSAAKGELRYGAPAEMDFDMLPSPTGLMQMLNEAETAWSVVESEAMPPGDLAARVLGDGQWTVDVTRLADDAPKLPALSTNEGKAVFRNWLACGAPIVTETGVPSWAHPPTPLGDGGVGFDVLYGTVLEPRCATSGCHDATGRAGGLDMSDACTAHSALLGMGTCGETYVVPGDAAASFLMDKLTAAMPRCGGPMPPPAGGLPAEMIDAVSAWIDAGAEGGECP